MPGGRPTAFDGEKTIEAAREYINGGYKAEQDMIPSAAGLARKLGVARQTLYDWGDKFSDILSECKAEQSRVLINKGLSGDFNSAITKLVLGKHGYHDKVDNTQAGADGGPLKVSYEVNVIAPKGK